MRSETEEDRKAAEDLAAATQWLRALFDGDTEERGRLAKVVNLRDVADCLAVILQGVLLQAEVDPRLYVAELEQLAAAARVDGFADEEI